MGLNKLFRRNGSDTTVVEVDPCEKICREMNESGKFFALYSRAGRYLVDQFGKFAESEKFDPEETFYLAMNLNFIQSFSNTVKLGIYSQTKTELISPELASFKLVYHMDEESIIHVGGKGDGKRVDVKDYDCGILLVRLKNPKDWYIPDNGMIRVTLKASLIFNPVELEDFLLKIPI